MRMRRKDREIAELNDIYQIMKENNCVILSFNNGTYPYSVPVSYGCTKKEDKITMYCHGAAAGTKHQLMQKDPHVAFTIVAQNDIVEHAMACDCTTEYTSVCGTGTVRILSNEEKIAALDVFMNQVVGEKEHRYHEQYVNLVSVFEIQVDSVTGKKLGV